MEADTGVERMIPGLPAQHDGDDELLAPACAFFDTLYAATRLIK